MNCPFDNSMLVFRRVLEASDTIDIRNLRSYCWQVLTSLAKLYDRSPRGSPYTTFEVSG